MKEIEAKFYPINPDSIRLKLKKNHANKICEKEMYRGQYFHGLHKNQVEWIRVRDENDKVVMTYKREDKNDINSIHEVEIEINSFEKGVNFLNELGLENETYSEKYRETWELNGAEIVIDWWPHLEPLCEVEANSEEQVIEIVRLLGLDIREAWHGGTGKIYQHVYGISGNGGLVLDSIDKLTFDQANPFI